MYLKFGGNAKNFSALSGLGGNRELNLREWKNEIVMLSSEKNRLYDKVYAMKADVQETEIIERCVEQAIYTESAKMKIKQRNIKL